MVAERRFSYERGTKASDWEATARRSPLRPGLHEGMRRRLHTRLHLEVGTREIRRARMPSDRGTVLEMADPGAMQGDVRRLPHRRRRGLPAAVADYVKFFNEERPMCCLGYMTPKQYREASLKRDPRPLPPYQCRHLPTVVYPKLNLMATND